MKTNVKKTITQLEKGLDITNIQLADALSQSINMGYVTEEEFANTLTTKADLVGGKVPAEQLPSYVDDVIDFVSIFNSTEAKAVIGNTNFVNKKCWCNSSPYQNKFIDFGLNTAESDWKIINPEEGKIYINGSNNHSYRWTGSILLDLDRQFANDIADLKGNVYINPITFSITNINDLTSGQWPNNTLAIMYECLFSSRLESRNMSIGVVYKSDIWTFPVLESDIEKNEFKIFNRGSLQTYSIKETGFTYTFTKVNEIPKCIFIKKDNVNTTALLSLPVNTIYPCVLKEDSWSLVGFFDRTTAVDGHFTGIFNSTLRSYHIDLTTGNISIIANFPTNAIWNQNLYISAGGIKGIVEVFSEMVASFTANTVVIPSTLLGTTLTEEMANKVNAASRLIVTEGNKAIIYDRSVYEEGTLLQFRNIRYVISDGVSTNSILYNTSNKSLSASIASLYNAYQYYRSAGGTKTEKEFQTAFVAVIDAGGGVVRYNVNQNLTSLEKDIAKQNIGATEYNALSVAFMVTEPTPGEVSFIEMTSASDIDKMTSAYNSNTNVWMFVIVSSDSSGNSDALQVIPEYYTEGRYWILPMYKFGKLVKIYTANDNVIFEVIGDIAITKK